MALLDVSDVLLDPDFADARIQCLRNTQTVGDDGIGVNTAQTLRFTGVVTSNAGDLLKRQAQGEHIEGSITIHSRFLLSAGGADQTADIVVWQGRRYTVSAVNDYSHFGRGFMAATCDLIPLSG